MRRAWVAGLSGLLLVACGGGGGRPGTGDGGAGDGAVADGGGVDAGRRDSGPAPMDAGTDGGPVEMVISLLAAGRFSAYIVYDTNMLLKRYPIDEYGECLRQRQGVWRD